MLDLDALFEADATSAKSPRVKGKWFEIRLTPDPVTGELLNVGVGFIQARTKAFHFRMLDSGAVFGCLYGPAGREQFEFLLNTVREALAAHGPSDTISPHITFGPQRYAAGDSAESIVDQMYRTVVSLARRTLFAPNDPQDEKANGGARSTEKVRNVVRSAFKRRDEPGFLEYWRDAPISVTVDEVPHSLDCQIWMGEDLVRSRAFASIVSACYIDEHYRRSFLTGAYHSLTIARSFSAKAKGGFFILAPDGSSRLAGLRRTIANEIDNTTWILKKRFNIVAEVEAEMKAIKEKALAFTS